MKGRIDDQTKARRLRSKGYALNEICKEVRASKSSVSCWVRDVKLTVAGEKRLESRKASIRNSHSLERGRTAWSLKCRLIRESWRQEGRIAAQSSNMKHAMGCMLYWAEGAKDRNSLMIANSDVAMLRLFYGFLVDEFDIEEADVKLRIHVYTEASEIKKIERYWKQGIGISNPVMGKHLLNPYNKNKVKPSERKNRVNKLPYGVCLMRVKNSTRILQHIYGALEVYAGVYLNPHTRRSSQMKSDSVNHL